MKVSVFGLGYVGSVSAASFAADGHEVVGVDVNADKVAAVNEGRSPIVEPGLDEQLAGAVAAGRLRATTDTAEAVRSTEVSLLCVGTPSRKNGSLDLSYLERVATQIGETLATKDAYHVVVVRSTVLPGTTHDVVIPALERSSGKKYGEGFGVSVNPEFLREGTALKDFRKPPLTLVGHNHAADASGTIALYQAIDSPLITTTIRVAPGTPSGKIFRLQGRGLPNLEGKRRGDLHIKVLVEVPIGLNDKERAALAALGQELLHAHPQRRVWEAALRART